MRMSRWVPLVLVAVSLLNALNAAVAVDNRQLDHLNVLQAPDRGDPGPAEVERASVASHSPSRVVERPEVVPATQGREMVSIASLPRPVKSYEAAMPLGDSPCAVPTRIVPPIHWAPVTFDRNLSCPHPDDPRRETACASCPPASSDAS